MRQILFLSLFACMTVLTGNDVYARGNASILAVAKSQVGVREYRGRGSNPRITNYFRRAVGRSYSDSYPWCSAFINYVTKRAGHRGTNSLSARSWLRWGRRTSNPRPGDIVVFGRRRGGHVGVFVGFSGNRVRVIGGNQSNSVSYKSYPRYRVLGYRTSGRGSSRPAKRLYAGRKRKRSRTRSRRYRVAALRTRGFRRAGRRVSKKRRRVASIRRRRARRNRQVYAGQPVYTTVAPTYSPYSQGSPNIYY